MEHPCFVGIDVSKAHLDVHVRPTGESFRVGHDDAGFVTLIARVRPFTPPSSCQRPAATRSPSPPPGRREAACRRGQSAADPRLRAGHRAAGQDRHPDARVIALLPKPFAPSPGPCPMNRRAPWGLVAVAANWSTCSAPSRIAAVSCVIRACSAISRPYRLAGGRHQPSRGRPHDLIARLRSGGSRRAAALGPRRGAGHIVRAHRRFAGARPPGSPSHCRPRGIGPGSPR